MGNADLEQEVILHHKISLLNCRCFLKGGMQLRILYFVCITDVQKLDGKTLYVHSTIQSVLCS